MPCVEAIQWILLDMDSKNLVLSNESGNEISTYHPHDIHSCYKMVTPKQFAHTQFYATWENVTTKEVIKSWCQDPVEFHQRPSPIYQSKS